MRPDFFAGSVLTALHVSKKVQINEATSSFSSADVQEFLPEIPSSQQNTLRGYSSEE